MDRGAKQATVHGVGVQRVEQSKEFDMTEHVCRHNITHLFSLSTCGLDCYVEMLWLKPVSSILH